MATPVLLFDVNETLLDVRALDPAFTRAFGSATARLEWFLTLQGLWMTSTLTDAYQPFDKLARAALDMTARREGRELDSSDRDAILEGLKTLPPHADVPGALEMLRVAGIRLAALTNGTRKGAMVQLRNARLDDMFDHVFSVDQVKTYKPAPKPYRFAARRLGVKPRVVYLVAAHAWDIAGAHAAGLSTVFVRRPGKVLNPSGPRPDIDVGDLGELARNIAVRRQRLSAGRTSGIRR
jgi:2-haloacid dehalogenase